MQGATGHDPHGRMRMRNVGQRTHTYTLTLSQGQEVRLHQGVAVDEICARGASTSRQPGTPSPRGISCAPGLLPRLAEHTASTPGGPRRASCARALPAPPRPAPPPAPLTCAAEAALLPGAVALGRVQRREGPELRTRAHNVRHTPPPATRATPRHRRARMRAHPSRAPPSASSCPCARTTWLRATLREVRGKRVTGRV